MDPLVSIIVPVYNVKPYLNRCVNSLLGQSYQNMELLLVDDGSTDGSETLCDEYAAQDARVRVLHKKNGGLSDARNAGVDAAKGEYLSFVDGDDWVSPYYIENLYRALEQGDMDTYQHIRDDLMNSMGVDGASIDSAMRSRYNKAVEKDPDYTLPQRARDLIGSRDKYAPVKEKEETFGADDLASSAYQAYSDQRANDYRSMADDLASSPIFRGMDDETRDKVLKAAYDLADKSALADHSDGQYEVSTKWMAQADDAEAQGIEPWEYVLFHTAYNEMEGTKDADGKTVKGEAKSDHVREWLEDFSGLTDEQRAFLWGTVYTSEW